MNQSVIFVSAIKFAWIVHVKKREPSVFLSFDNFIISSWTLLSSETWNSTRTLINITSFISRSFSNAKWSTMNWCWMIAFSCLHWNTSTTWSWAWSPFRPVTPTTINRSWEFLNVNTFLILTPLLMLRRNLWIKIKVTWHLWYYLLTLCRAQCVPGAAGLRSVVHVPFNEHHNCEQISSSCEQTFKSSSVALNCRRHCKSALYIAPAGSSGYWYSSKGVGASSKHLPSPWLLRKIIIAHSHVIQNMITYSRKWLISRRLQLDHETWTVSASKLGVMICKIGPILWTHPVFSVSWYMPKL